MSTCKRQEYYARSGGAKQPGRSHYTAICRDSVAKRNRTTRNSIKNRSSKTGSRRQNHKNDFEGFKKGKSPEQKLTKSADKSLSQPGCSHSNTIWSVQLQNTIVWRTQPWLQANLMKPLHCILQPQLPKHNVTATRKNTQKTSKQPVQRGLRRDQPAPAAHTRYLSSPAAATLHGKTQGFVLRLSPQIKPHATLMQLIQCVSQANIPSLILMWCKVSHHRSLRWVSQFQCLCDVNYHTILHWGESHNSNFMWCELSHHPALSTVAHFQLLCTINSHTTIHWV